MRGRPAGSTPKTSPGRWTDGRWTDGHWTRGRAGPGRPQKGSTRPDGVRRSSDTGLRGGRGRWMIWVLFTCRSFLLLITGVTHVPPKKHLSPDHLQHAHDPLGRRGDVLGVSDAPRPGEPEPPLAVLFV